MQIEISSYDWSLFLHSFIFQFILLRARTGIFSRPPPPTVTFSHQKILYRLHIHAILFDTKSLSLCCYVVVNLLSIIFGLMNYADKNGSGTINSTVLSSLFSQGEMLHENSPVPSFFTPSSFVSYNNLKLAFR